MKRSELVLGFLRLPVDILMVFLAAVLAYKVRLGLEISSISFLNLKPVSIFPGGIVPYDQYLRAVFFLVPIIVALFAYQGLYSLRARQKLIDELFRISFSLLVSVMLASVAIFFGQVFDLSRLIVLAGLVLAIIFVSFGRVALRLIRRLIYALGFGTKKVLLIGGGPQTWPMVEEILGDPGAGFSLLGIVYSRPGLIGDLAGLERHIVGRIGEIGRLTKELKPDEIIVSDPSLSQKKINELLEISRLSQIDFRYTPNLFDVRTKNVELSFFGGVPLVGFRRTPLEGWGRIVKRLIDLFGSLFSIILLSPVFLVVALLVKATSRGPVIYKNIRLGPKGEFSVYKFRTMKLEFSTGEDYGGKWAELFERKLIKRQSGRAGGIYKIADDPRVTRLGFFFRLTSLDELPQLFNVLLGSMSLIGPRPHQPREVKYFAKSYQRLMAVKPGITGLAQVSGRSDLSTDEEMRLESYYVEQWSPWLDLVIFFRTPAAIFNRRRTV